MSFILKIIISIIYFLFIDIKPFRWLIGGRWEKWHYSYHTHIGKRWINVYDKSIPYGYKPHVNCRGNYPIKMELYGKERPKTR